MVLGKIETKQVSGESLILDGLEKHNQRALRHVAHREDQKHEWYFTSVFCLILFIYEGAWTGERVRCAMCLSSVFRVKIPELRHLWRCVSTRVSVSSSAPLNNFFFPFPCTRCSGLDPQQINSILFSGLAKHAREIHRHWQHQRERSSFCFWVFVNWFVISFFLYIYLAFSFSAFARTCSVLCRWAMKLVFYVGC